MLIIVGPPGAGKTTLAEFVQECGRFMCYEAGDVMRHLHSSEDSSLAMLPFVDRVFRESGKDAVARIVAEQIETKDADLSRTIVCGFRTVEEVQYFKATYGDDVEVVGVFCDFGRRYERVLRRDSKQPTLYPQSQFLARSMKEYAWGVAALLADHARTILDNSGSIEILRREAQKIAASKPVRRQ